MTGTQATSATPTQTALTAIPTPVLSGLACRLPIYVDRADGTGPHGEFVDLPSGSVTFAANGDGGRYYDRRFSRWLPVDSHAVSPDESHYAEGGDTADGQPYLRIVDVASGESHSYNLPKEMYDVIGGTHVFEYTNDSIYLGIDLEGYVGALWTFDIASGTTTFRSITGIGAVDGATVWRSTLNSADPNAWSFTPGSPQNQIERLDIRDGSSQLWLYRPGHLVGVVGVDGSHHPIVLDMSDRQNVELTILTSPTTQLTIEKGSIDTAWFVFSSGVLVDSHGIWFGGDKGFYLFSEAGGVQKVSDQKGWPAGACA